MNRFIWLISLVLLAGCMARIGPTPPSIPSVPRLKVVSANVATNYRTTNGTSVICDNRATTLLYSFRYEGQLSRWTSYLQGQTFGDIKGRRSFTPNTQGVVPSGERGYEVQYVMSANFAPYIRDADDDTLISSAINVIPVPQPTRIGATKLTLTLQGGNRDARFVSPDIPVIINCP